jgi:CDP-diacylglycerol--serine O-phosphatidyltransferase
MLLDAIDGKVARMVGGASSFGAQLDSFSDMITFGVAPAVLVKVLIEHEGPLYASWGNPWDNPRIHFIAAATFSLMAMLRLARFNLETEPDASTHKMFSGLPSPGAAGSVCAALTSSGDAGWGNAAQAAGAERRDGSARALAVTE